MSERQKAVFLGMVTTAGKVNRGDAGEDERGDRDKPKNGRSGGRSNPRVVKSANIITEHIDVGVPAQMCFDQWTQYDKWSEIFKKESAEKPRRSGGDSGSDDDGDGSGNVVTVNAKIGPSSRSWKAEIVKIEPGHRISWRAKGGLQAKGSSSFHRLDDRLTRVMVEIEYEPSGFVESFGNFFRMQRRRVRRDLRLFKNYIELRGKPTGSGPKRVEGEGLRRDVDEGMSGEDEEGEDK